MSKLSANLGYLWTELSLVEAIQAAASAGFDAVECHWPFATPAGQVRSTLLKANLPMISLNTSPGNLELGEFGLCALPGRVSDARETIRQAIDYAAEIGAASVHVMSGKTLKYDLAMEVYLDNLDFAADLAQKAGLSVVIEPIGRATIADYFLADMNTAVDIVTKLKQPNIKILFDCYHIYNIHGDLKPLLERYIDLIGHIQIASIPARHEPDEGEVDYPALLKWLDDLGYKGYVGAEYKPRTTTDAGLGWMKDVFSNH